MPFQPVNNTALFTCLFAVGHTEKAQFGVYVNDDAHPWDASQLQAKAAEIRDAINSDYLPALSENHDFLGVVGRDLEDQFGRVEDVMLGAPAPGTLASPSLPGNVAVVGTFKSALGAPRRGRIYMMPPAEIQVVGDLLTLAAQAALQGALEAIHAAATAGPGASHVIVSRFAGSTLVPGPRGQTVRKPTPRNPAIVADVASVTVKRRTDSMRSRLTKEPA